MTSTAQHDSSFAETHLTPQRIRLYAILGGAVLLVALVTWFLMAAGQRKEAFGARALESARAVAESGDMGAAVQQFEQVATTYSGTDAASEARLGVAQARLLAGQAELAIVSLREFIDSKPKERFLAPAHSLLATALENTTKHGEAAVEYRRASEVESVPYLKATLLLDAGRATRAAGDRDGAIAIYREVVEKFGDTAARSEAEVRLLELTAEPA